MSDESFGTDDAGPFRSPGEHEMMPFGELPEELWGIMLYAATLGAVLPLAQNHRHSHAGALAIWAMGFVVLVPTVLIPVKAFSSREWPTRVFAWHRIACAWILVLALIVLVAGWLGRQIA